MSSLPFRPPYQIPSINFSRIWTVSAPNDLASRSTPRAAYPEGTKGAAPVLSEAKEQRRTLPLHFRRKWGGWPAEGPPEGPRLHPVGAQGVRGQGRVGPPYYRAFWQPRHARFGGGQPGPLQRVVRHQPRAEAKRKRVGWVPGLARLPTNRANTHPQSVIQVLVGELRNPTLQRFVTKKRRRLVLIKLQHHGHINVLLSIIRRVPESPHPDTMALNLTIRKSPAGQLL